MALRAPRTAGSLPGSVLVSERLRAAPGLSGTVPGVAPAVAPAVAPDGSERPVGRPVGRPGAGAGDWLGWTQQSPGECDAPGLCLVFVRLSAGLMPIHYDRAG